jgi:hypothetical protein
MLFQKNCIQFSVVSSLGFLNNRCCLGRQRCCFGLGIKKVYKNEAWVSFLVIVTFFCLLVLLLCSFCACLVGVLTLCCQCLDLNF